jgi:catechol 2,3-dioxygenase-like lactoylglutathione lyase family enzyme
MTDPDNGPIVGAAERVFAITLFIDDLAAARRFYDTVFGMPIVHQDPTSTAYEFPNLVVNLVATENAPELITPASVGAAGTPARMMLTLQVDDVDAVCDRLREHGVPLLNGPMTRPWGPRTAAFADPSGHVWELSD